MISVLSFPSSAVWFDHRTLPFPSINSKESESVRFLFIVIDKIYNSLSTFTVKS